VDRKIYVLIGAALVLLGTILYIGLMEYSTTAFVVLPGDDGVDIPDLTEGVEKEYKGLKYKDNLGIVVSTEPIISCSWKDPLEDDGWKECEAVFEVQDLRSERQRLNDPNIKFNFVDENIRNIEISYSGDYEVIEEEVVESSVESEVVKILVNETNLTDSVEEGSVGITGRAISEYEDVIENVYNESERIVGVHRTVPITRRKFENFDPYSSSKTEVSDSLSEGINSKSLLSGLVVSQEKEDGFFDFKKINTKKPFAVKINFEAPKYSTNQFDFEIQDQNFNADIDPIISGCGTLNVGNREYVLDQDVSSAGTCFTISAENVVLNCNGHTINFSVEGSAGYGVYSTEDATTVENCKIVSGNKNASSARGIFYSGVGRGVIANNNISLDLESSPSAVETGIYFYETTNTEVENNYIQTSGNVSYGMYFEFYSSNNQIQDNDFSGVSVTDGGVYSVYLDSGSDGNTFERNDFFVSSSSTGYVFLFESLASVDISNNDLVIDGSEGYGVYSEDSSGASVSSNSINHSADSGSAIRFVSSGSGNTITQNTVSSYGDEVDGIYIEETDETVVSNNSVVTSGERAHAIYLSQATGGNLIYNNLTTSGESSYGFDLVISSNSNTISENSIVTSGDDGFGIKTILSSIDNDILNNNIFTSGSTGNGLNFESGSNVANNNLINASGAEGYGVYINDADSINMSNNEIYTSGSMAYGVYLDSGSNLNRFENNLVTTFEDESYGFSVEISSGNNSFIGNNLTVFGSDSYAFDILSGDNLFFGNKIISYGDYAYAYYLEWENTGNNLSEEEIYTFGLEGHGIVFGANSHNISLTNLKVATVNSSAHAIYSESGLQVIDLIDGILTTPHPTSYGLFLGSSAGEGIWNFTNVSFDEAIWYSGAQGTLNVKWYLDVNTAYDNGTLIEGTNVSVYDSEDVLIYSGLSDSMGDIERQTLDSYTQDINSKNYSSEYTIGGTAPDEQTDAEFANLTENLYVELEFEGTGEVVQTSPSSTSGGSSSSENEGFGEEDSDCKRQWECTSWSECNDELQYRTCVEKNTACDSPKPIEERGCGKGRKDALFDILVDLPRQELKIGEKPLASITLINLGVEGIVKAVLQYKISDDSGNVVYEETEIQDVDTQLEFIKTFDDLELEEGRYSLLVDLSYDGQLYPAESESVFVVGDISLSPGASWGYIVLVGIIAGLLFVSIIVIYMKMFKGKDDVVASSEGAGEEEMSGQGSVYVSK
jgi:nitrous oxidase accessory protein